ncbi:MAG: hypothetical protein EBT95_08765 [Verrucomicrobia bacterium]|nr:hypothetical protein [Verrucomicrobiota bacterium]
MAETCGCTFWGGGGESGFWAPASGLGSSRKNTRAGSSTFTKSTAPRPYFIEHLYEKHGAKTVFLGRFIPAVRFGVFFFAGRHRMPIRKFLGLNALGAILYAPLWIWLSAVAGEKFSQSAAAQKAAEHWVERGSLILIGFVLVVIALTIWGAGKKKPST